MTFPCAKVADTPPLFVFGMERSGTTLLSMMLDAHSEIAVPLATGGFWYDLADRIGGDAGVDSAAKLDAVVAEVCAHPRIARWRLTTAPADIADQCRVGAFASIVRAFHAGYAAQEGKAHWANLDIATLDEMHRANAWFPNARFLHIYRDGRDVAVSNRTMPYGPGNLAECLDAWRVRVRTNLRMGAIVGASRYCAVAYEDLVARPEVTLRRICSFLGLAFEPAMLDSAARARAKIPADRRWLWPKLSQRIDAEGVSRWRRELNRTQQRVAERHAGELLRELGYPAAPVQGRSIAAECLDLIYFLDRGKRTRRLLSALGLNRPSKLERAARRRPARVSPA